ARLLQVQTRMSREKPASIGYRHFDPIGSSTLEALKLTSHPPTKRAGSSMTRTAAVIAFAQLARPRTARHLPRAPHCRLKSGEFSLNAERTILRKIDSARNKAAW